ncbi:DUF5313 domain-containing protein [Mycolicibacterium sp. CBMA 361]|uniref:DUF5313 domain-containing protein n=1 Tax=Mycolicibacterium sp. CBMA 361 TaxID=2606610 RepID=UPI0012DC0265|nr:DUF5313 domain-containing protein [Mycolicibacterium sp. CBMA 361]MUM31825.1 hypothetical protein [Mycolicibacterium sp. CBMA 361]
MATDSPTFWQRITYAYGRHLPDHLQDWVREDLTGDGAVRRHMVRYAIPPVFVLAPLWLLPASVYVHSEMTLPIYFWAIVMSFVLNKVWRRYRLSQHGLDPNLIDEILRQKQSQMHERYIERFGPRPESAKWQANSRPF